MSKNITAGTIDFNALSQLFDERGLQILKVLHHIRTVDQNLTNKFNNWLRQHGYEITLDQWRILRGLYITDKDTLSNICKFSNQDLGAVSRMLSRMEKIGYIKRIKNSSDQRQRLITLTQKSADDRQELFELAGFFAKSLLDGFSDSELEKFAEFLERLLKTIDKPLEREF